MKRYQILLHNPAADEMLLDDLFQYRRIATAVPSAVWIDQRDGAAGANLKTVRLAAKDSAGSEEAQLLETRFEIVPSHERLLARAAFRLRLVAAKKDVPADRRHMQLLGQPPLLGNQFRKS